MYKYLLVSLLLLTYLPATETNTHKSPRIINGTKVSSDDDKWRFIVALKDSDGQYCAGSLISSHWVLTSAHCLFDDSSKKLKEITAQTVGAKSYNLNKMTQYKIKRFIAHPSFDIDTLDNDIALIELNSDVSDIKPITYDTSHSLSVGTQTKVAGWGNISTSSNVYVDDLREALTPILDYNKCNSNYKDEKMTDNMLCAGYYISTRDACDADSGGPLVVDNTLVGMVSWGYECAADNYPGVYTKVQNYSKWIAKSMGSDDNTTYKQHFETKHPYTNDENITGTLGVSNATCMKVTLSGVLEDDYDFISINNQKYTGILNTSFTVQNNAIDYHFTSDNTIVKYGIRLGVESCDSNTSTEKKHETSNFIRTLLEIFLKRFLED